MSYVVLDNLPPGIPQAQQKQQHSAICPAQSSLGQVRADQSATTQASRQNWRDPLCRRAFIQIAVFSKRTKKSKSARPTKKYVPGTRVLNYDFLSVFPTSYMRRPGCFLEHEALGICYSRQIASIINRGPLWPHHSHFVLFLLVSERRGRRKPPDAHTK